MKRTYKIEVECANCANKMEQAAEKVAGVQAVSVNFLLQRIAVEFAEGSDPKEVMAEVQRVCRRIESDCSIEF